MQEKIAAVTILCDVIGSRENSEYKNSLNNIIAKLKQKYKDISSPFTIRNGDEIFGVSPNFSDGYSLFKDIYFLSKEQRISLYIGIGYGYIYKQSIDDAHQIQGSSIWNAADAIKFIKEDKVEIKSLDKNFKYYVNYSGDNFPHLNINYQLYLILEKIMKRTEKQQKAIELIEQYPELTLNEIGLKLKYNSNSSTNVSKILSRAEYQLVHGAEQSLMELLNDYQVRLQNDYDGENIC